MGAGELAVAPGRLVRQTAGPDGRRTMHFQLAAPTPPAHVALAVGPFTVVPGAPASRNGRDGGGGAEARAGAGGTLVTHLGPPQLAAELAHGARFAPLAFDLFETFLGCSFPFPAFHAVSVPPGAAPACVQAAAGMQARFVRYFGKQCTAYSPFAQVAPCGAVSCQEGDVVLSREGRRQRPSP